jgi:hypothetical protein
MHTKKLMLASLLLFAFLPFYSYAQIGMENVEKKVGEMGLDTLRKMNVLVYFNSADSLRAKEIADISLSMFSFFKEKFDIYFDFKVAALRPENWFSEYPGMPYAIPWNFMPDKILMMPSSITEGVMVEDNRSLAENRLSINRVLVHEYSHLIEKEYFRKNDTVDYLHLTWLNEFVVNYFTHAYIHNTDKKWAEEIERLDLATVKGEYQPEKYTLDWSFMNDLPPNELCPTYGWYQNLLTVKAIDLYNEYGLGFLSQLKEQLDWNNCANWTTPQVLQMIEEIAPGFTAWSQNIENYVRKEGKE